jgi:hypothetical protein
VHSSHFKSSVDGVSMLALTGLQALQPDPTLTVAAAVGSHGQPVNIRHPPPNIGGLTFVGLPTIDHRPSAIDNRQLQRN